MHYDVWVIGRKRIKKLIILLWFFWIGFFLYNYFSISSKINNISIFNPSSYQTLLARKEYKGEELNSLYASIISSWGLKEQYKKELTQNIEFSYVSLEPSTKTASWIDLQNITLKQNKLLFDKDKIFIYWMQNMETEIEKKNVITYIKYNEEYLKKESFKILIKKHKEVISLIEEYAKEIIEKTNQQFAIKETAYSYWNTALQNRVGCSLVELVNSSVESQGEEFYWMVWKNQLFGGFDNIKEKDNILLLYWTNLLSNPLCVKEMVWNEEGKKIVNFFLETN